MKNLKMKSARAALDLSQQQLADLVAYRGRPSTPLKKVIIIRRSDFASRSAKC